MPARPLLRRSRPLVAAALLAPLAVAGPALADGEATPPQAQSTATFCASVPADYEPFRDLDGNDFKAVVECLARAEISQGGPKGLPADQYGPSLTVDRDAMATFLVRVIDAADALEDGDTITALPPFDGTVDFTDVPADNVHRESIDRLAEAGIVRGGAGGTPQDRYSPGVAVQRAQMATFLDAALEFMTGDDFSTPDDYFTDDEEFTAHEEQINVVAAEAIAVGDGADSYRPGVLVRRDQMAGFLVRTLAVLEADGDIGPLP